LKRLLTCLALLPLAIHSETLEYRSSKNGGFQPSHRRESWRTIILIGRESLLLCEQLARALDRARAQGDRAYASYFELIQENRRCFSRQGRLCSQIGQAAGKTERQLFFLFVEALKAQGRSAYFQQKTALPSRENGFAEPGLKELQDLNKWHTIDRQTLQELKSAGKENWLSTDALYVIYLRSLCSITENKRRCDLLGEYLEGEEFQKLRKSLPGALQ
jgi:hypothetical protein